MSSSIITSIVTAGTNSHVTTSYEANAFATDFVGQGIVGGPGNTLGVSPATGAFAINAQSTPAMLVDVTAGVAWITATPSGEVSQSLRAYMASNYTSYTISSNASGSTKYDWIYLQVNPTAAASPASDASDVTALYTSRSSSNSVDNGSPPAYGILLAVVTVANGASSITNGNILDQRTQVVPAASIANSGTGWSVNSTTPNSITALGNRSYSLVFNSTDLTATLSKGMRLRTSRTTLAPTQCASLNGSSNYFNKTSPSGMTFTDDFVVSAWVKLSAYGNAGGIASRYNGTSGWIMYITSSGQVQLQGNNAGSSNFSYVLSAQSIPLNKWVHVAAELDMSSFSVSGTTSWVMIDGVDVPATVVRGGSNPTALIQAGNLEIGSYNGGTNLFDGQICQVAIYNAKVTEANVLKTISQGLVGTETSLISAYSLSNSLTDLNTNANNLTAQGSAAATTVDNPFSDDTIGSISYGIIMGASFSTNTTLTVQVPEGANLPTTGGLSTLSYSTAKVPYGFPAQKTKWTILMLNETASSQSSPSNATWYNIGSQQLNIPLGAWDVDYIVNLYGQNTSSAQATVALRATLSTANNSESDIRFTTGLGGDINQSNAVSLGAKDFLDLSAPTVYYLNSQKVAGTLTELYNLTDASGRMGQIRAECTYV